MGDRSPTQVGLVIYPEMTQLDITGPHQVFAMMPDTQVHFLWKTLEPFRSNDGLTLLPTTTQAAGPELVDRVRQFGEGLIAASRAQTQATPTRLGI